MSLIVEKVPCCICNESGKVKRLVFWTRDCPACDGEGRRRIILDDAFSADIKSRLRLEATHGINYLPRPHEPLAHVLSIFM